jgi:cobalamin biosynthesis Co2+ chelatase CbiK
MGFFSKMMNKAGSWHVKQLVQDCIKEMMEASMYDNQQVNNPYPTDNTLNLMIEHNKFKYLKNQKFKNLESKFNSVVQLWVRIKLGRDLDVESDDYEVLFDSIEKVRPYFMKTESGVTQKLKEE